MRLLDTITGQFVEVFDLQRRPRYAILSHTWSIEGEQTYQELRVIQETYVPASPSPSSHAPTQPSSNSLPPSESAHAIWDDPRLSPKIRRACEAARLNGYHYIWIDSCCIDKSSSSELSEAINSMYMWYRDADLCYVYLADVPGLSYLSLSAPDSAFRRSRWFTRGWTLQELIAPQRIVFLSQEWRAFGTKVTLMKLLEEITGISGEVLIFKVRLDQVSVARRMSWAAPRETTRVEDRAYSLFGIFDVNLPTLYGERDRAFQRLQEEILRRIPDQSLFAWSEISFYTNVVDEFVCRLWARGTVREKGASSLFASSPSAFANSTIDIMPSDKYLHLLQPLAEERLFQGHVQSPFGVQVTFPVICVDHPSKISSGAKASSYYLVILPCTSSDTREPHLLARFCVSGPTSPELLYWVPIDHSKKHIIVVKAQDIARLQSKLLVKTFHLAQHRRTKSPSPETADPYRVFRTSKGPNVVLALSSTSRTILEAQGYTVEFLESRNPTQTSNDCAYDLIMYTGHSNGSGVDSEGPSESTSQPSQILYKSLKLTVTHRLREDRPLTMWVVRGPHALDLLHSLGPSSSSSDLGTYDPQQTTIVRQVVSRRIQGTTTTTTTPLIRFAQTELPPSIPADRFVETLHLTLEPDCSNDFYHVHVEISAVEREVQPPTSHSSSQIQLVPASRELDAVKSEERLPKSERDLIPPCTDADDHGDKDGEEEGMEASNSAGSSLSRGRIFKLFQKWRK